MTLVKLILYFIVVIGVLYLAYRTTKFVGQRSAGSQATANMRVLERVFVGKDSSLLIVEVQGRYLLLGATPSSIVKLEELEEYTGIQSAASGTDFSQILSGQLKDVLSRGGKKNNRGTKE